METKKIIAIFFALLLLVSCGSSTIVLTNTQRPYKIYVDKKYIGTHNVKVARSGLPKKMTIDVKDAADQTLVHEVVRRDLNLIQFAAGFL